MGFTGLLSDPASLNAVYIVQNIARVIVTLLISNVIYLNKNLQHLFVLRKFKIVWTSKKKQAITIMFCTLL